MSTSGCIGYASGSGSGSGSDLFLSRICFEVVVRQALALGSPERTARDRQESRIRRRAFKSSTSQKCTSSKSLCKANTCTGQVSVPVPLKMGKAKA